MKTDFLLFLGAFGFGFNLIFIPVTIGVGIILVIIYVSIILWGMQLKYEEFKEW